MTSNTLANDKIELLAGISLLLVSALLLFASIVPGHDWGGDFAAYIHQGKALADGSVDQLRTLVQYRVENSTSEKIIGPDFYPWGFPAILAMIIAIFGESLLIMKSLMIGFVLGCQVIIYFLLRGRVQSIVCYSIAFAFAINSFVLAFKDNILSDIPFTFFVLLTLLLSRNFLLEKKNPSILNLVCIGLAMSAAFSIRAHAITLVPTVALLQLIGKTNFLADKSVLRLVGGIKQIRLSDLIPHVIFVLIVALVAAVLSDPIESYSSTGHAQARAGFLARTLATIEAGIIYYGRLPSSLFPVPNIVYVFVVVPTLMLGVYRAGFRNLDLVIFVFFHMAVLMIFPGRQGLRFILPVLPILFLFVFLGSIEILRWVSSLLRRENSTTLGEGLLTIILVVGISGPTAVQSIQKRLVRDAAYVQPGPYSTNSRAVFEYIKNNTAEDESIVFWKPRVLAYLTNRKSAFCFRIDELANGRHQYVLVHLGEYYERDMGKLLIKTTAEYPDNFTIIYQNPDFALYEIKPTGIGGASNSSVSPPSIS